MGKKITQQRGFDLHIIRTLFFMEEFREKKENIFKKYIKIKHIPKHGDPFVRISFINKFVFMAEKTMSQISEIQ